MKKIMIINGPNLNLLGKREVDIYGNISFKSYLENLKKKYSEVDIDFFQSNIEGELIDKIQEVGFSYDGIVLNAAAYTHTSVGISDSIAAVSSPVIEVHISNIHAREEFRSRSLISKNVKGIICGFGLKSYDLAIDSIIYK
jgi:3-dehydroquinate dehydratase-2|tara:strand:+ start:87 stop:509 length:423 start_codon:yes stop_codon:yes gene_type:complete